MIVTIDGRTIYVSRETGEDRIRTESHFWFKLRNALQAKGQDWKRIRPCNKGMTSMPYALQLGPTRKRNEWIIDNNYDTRQPHKQFNEREPVVLSMFEAERN